MAPQIVPQLAQEIACLRSKTSLYMTTISTCTASFYVLNKVMPENGPGGF